MSTPYIKVCGMTGADSVRVAGACGARMVGFIFHDASPRAITTADAAVLDTGDMLRVGVFVRQRAHGICSMMREARLDYAQFHGEQSVQEALAVGPSRVIKVLWPEQEEGPQALQQRIDEWEPFCAFYLLDAGRIGSGGLGRSLNAAALASLRFPRPWMLAGGLHAGNIPETLRLCHPDGLDLNSGVESAPGRKSLRLLQEAVAASREH